ncbi:hypothetical protein ACFYSF_22675 [Streptomyces canus]|uniref:hypothetical protein n=1 Tax=Streptomyces canus TaxID=58343 RepID=UPI00367988F7
MKFRNRPSVPSTKDMEKQAKQKAKEQAASTKRARMHKVALRRFGPEPFPKFKDDDD